MHELSLVEALLERVAEHVPAGARLRGVRVRAGAARAIEPELMQWAWRAATAETAWEGAELALEITPYTLACAACGRRVASEDPWAGCPCGNAAPEVAATDELTLVAITVEDEDPAEAPGGGRKEMSR